jgi:hypothetical protein
VWVVELGYVKPTSLAWLAARGLSGYDDGTNEALSDSLCGLACSVWRRVGCRAL